MTALEPLLAAIAVPPGDMDTLLELDSLQVVELVDLLETHFAACALSLDSADVTRTNFATRRALAALLRRKGAPCD